MERTRSTKQIDSFADAFSVLDDLKRPIKRLECVCSTLKCRAARVVSQTSVEPEIAFILEEIRNNHETFTILLYPSWSYYPIVNGILSMPFK